MNRGRGGEGRGRRRGRGGGEEEEARGRGGGRGEGRGRGKGRGGGEEGETRGGGGGEGEEGETRRGGKGEGRVRERRRGRDGGEEEARARGGGEEGGARGRERRARDGGEEKARGRGGEEGGARGRERRARDGGEEEARARGGGEEGGARGGGEEGGARGRGRERDGAEDPRGRGGEEGGARGRGRRRDGGEEEARGRGGGGEGRGRGRGRERDGAEDPRGRGGGEEEGARGRGRRRDGGGEEARGGGEEGGARGRGRRRDGGEEEARGGGEEGGARGRGRRARPRRAVDPPGNVLEASIPDPVLAPVPRPPRLGSETRVFFDLETTGFGPLAHIIQIGAVSPDGTYSSYVMQDIAIGARASAVTGISLERGLLMHHGRVVEAVSIRDALKGFFDFLRPGRALLIGHNAKVFDSRVLVTAATNAGMIDLLKMQVLGFLDTLPLLRHMYPRRRNFQLEHLHSSLVGGRFAAHTALEDSLALERLVEKVNPDQNIMEAHTFDVEFVEASLSYLAMRKENLKTLYPLENVNVTPSMLDKIAGSGLRMEHLRAAYESDRENGIRGLFRQPLPDGKARVTRIKSIADKARIFFDRAEFMPPP